MSPEQKVILMAHYLKAAKDGADTYIMHIKKLNPGAEPPWTLSNDVLGNILKALEIVTK